MKVPKLTKFASGLALILGLLGRSEAVPLLITPDGQKRPCPSKGAAPPESPANAEFRKGVAALLKSDLQKAADTFRTAAKMDAKLAAPLIGLANVEMARNHPKEAENWLSQASALEPNGPAVQLAWARYYRAQGKNTEAERALLKSLEVVESVPAYLELADLYLANPDKRGEALNAYKKALALAPDNPQVRFSYAAGLAANGQVDLAIEEFEQVAKMSPKDPEPLRSLGRLHAERHQFDKAASEFDLGLKLKPDSVPLLVDRGDMAAALGKMAEAIHFYETAIKYAPNSPELLVKLGMSRQLSGQVKEAEADYFKAIKLDPKFAAAYNNLAWLKIQQGQDFAGAVQGAQKAVQLEPGEPAYRDTLGWALRAQGNLKKSAETLEQAARGKTASAELLYHLGIVYAELGKRSEAIGALKGALGQKDANFSQSEDARKRLKDLGG